MSWKEKREQKQRLKEQAVYDNMSKFVALTTEKLLRTEKNWRDDDFLSKEERNTVELLRNKKYYDEKMSGIRFHDTHYGFLNGTKAAILYSYVSNFLKACPRVVEREGIWYVEAYNTKGDSEDAPEEEIEEAKNSLRIPISQLADIFNMTPYDVWLGLSMVRNALVESREIHHETAYKYAPKDFIILNRRFLHEYHNFGSDYMKSDLFRIPYKNSMMIANEGDVEPYFLNFNVSKQENGEYSFNYTYDTKYINKDGTLITHNESIPLDKFDLYYGQVLMSWDLGDDYHDEDVAMFEYFTGCFYLYNDLTKEQYEYAKEHNANFRNDFYISQTQKKMPWLVNTHMPNYCRHYDDGKNELDYSFADFIDNNKDAWEAYKKEWLYVSENWYTDRHAKQFENYVQQNSTTEMQNILEQIIQKEGGRKTLSDRRKTLIEKIQQGVDYSLENGRWFTNKNFYEFSPLCHYIPMFIAKQTVDKDIVKANNPEANDIYNTYHEFHMATQPDYRTHKPIVY